MISGISKTRFIDKINVSESDSFGSPSSVAVTVIFTVRKYSSALFHHFPHLQLTGK